MQTREAYCFLLGLSTGATILTITSYRRVSPAWLKWLLMGSGMLLITHYLTLALLTTPAPLHDTWPLRFVWHTMSMTLLFPGVMAIDQLLRHPAMSPKTLLTWLAPVLTADAVIGSLARLTVTPNPAGGWISSLDSGSMLLGTLLHEAVLVTAIAACLLLIRKPLPRLMRQALAGLAGGFAVFGIMLALFAARQWLQIPLLLSEVLLLLALWYAYETGAELQRTGG